MYLSITRRGKVKGVLANWPQTGTGTIEHTRGSPRSHA
jgi:hypothetical protein